VRDVTTNDDADLDADLAALAVKRPAKPGPPCGVAAAIARIRETHPERADQVVALIDNPGVPANEVAVFLSRHGGRLIKGAALRYHRRRGTVSGCSCA
jgi:hypothetical protein